MINKRQNMIQLLILIGLGLSILFSLLIPQAPHSRRSSPPPEISVIIREPDSSTWFNTRQGMEQAAGDLTADLRFLPLGRSNDAREQEELLLREVSGGTDIFLIAPADPLSLEGKLPALSGERIVLSLESPMCTADDVVAADNTGIGQALARDLAKHWDGGTVLLINSSSSCTAVTQRLQAARQVLEEAGIPCVMRTCPSDSLPEILPRLTSITAAHYVMVFEHTATLNAAQAKEDSALTSQIYGVGSCGRTAAYLEQGILQSVAAWSDYAVGYLAVARAVGLYDGSVSWPGKTVDFFIVHREDIYDPDIQKLLFPVTS